MIFMDETKKVDFIMDKWISLRTSGFVNLLVRWTSRFLTKFEPWLCDSTISDRQKLFSCGRPNVIDLLCIASCFVLGEISGRKN